MLNTTVYLSDCYKNLIKSKEYFKSEPTLAINKCEILKQHLLTDIYRHGQVLVTAWNKQNNCLQKLS